MLELGHCKEKGCSIVNCASIYSFRATPLATAYATTKHALVGLTKTFALAYAKEGIRTNNINPAFSPSELTAFYKTAEENGVETISNWHPAGRWLENKEVVDGLIWLWSGKSAFYNGQNLILDSGLTAQWVPTATYNQQITDLTTKLGELQKAAEKKEL